MDWEDCFLNVAFVQATTLSLYHLALGRKIKKKTSRLKILWLKEMVFRVLVLIDGKALSQEGQVVIG